MTDEPTESAEARKAEEDAIRAKQDPIFEWLAARTQAALEAEGDEE